MMVLIINWVLISAGKFRKDDRSSTHWKLLLTPRFLAENWGNNDFVHSSKKMYGWRDILNIYYKNKLDKK